MSVRGRDSEGCDSCEEGDSSDVCREDVATPTPMETPKFTAMWWFGGTFDSWGYNYLRKTPTVHWDPSVWPCLIVVSFSSEWPLE